MCAFVCVLREACVSGGRGRAAVSLSGVQFSGEVRMHVFYQGPRYLQQEPLVANDRRRVPVDDLGERQLPAITQHHRHTRSLKHTHRVKFGRDPSQTQSQANS